MALVVVGPLAVFSLAGLGACGSKFAVVNRWRIETWAVEGGRADFTIEEDDRANRVEIVDAGETAGGCWNLAPKTGSLEEGTTKPQECS